MIRKILIIFNPVSLFLLFNIITLKENTLYERVLELERIEYVNIGSSHGLSAFNYSYYDNSVNLGFGSQRMYFGLKVLESIEPQLDSSSTIIIPISIFSFCGSFDGPKQRYLGFLSREELGISLGEEILEIHFPYFGINNTESLLLKYEEEIIEFQNNGFERAQYHLSLARECNIIDELIVEQIKDFIERNNESRIVFIITPYHDTYWEKILNEAVVVERIYDTINDVVEKYSLDFLDYSDDPRFYTAPHYFRDSDHLNNDGAVLFTKIVIDELTMLDLI